MSLQPESTVVDGPNPNAGGLVQPPSPAAHLSPRHPSDSQRRIAIAVDLSDESAYAVRWAVQNYLRPDDLVFFLHVRPTSVLYGADWGSVELRRKSSGGGDDDSPEESQQKLEDDFDNFTTSKASDLAQPLVEANISFKIHIVKDRDMKERLCLEVERLGLSAVIMGSRGFGASKRITKGRLGSVSDYCVHHCVCPVVVVRLPDDKGGFRGGDEQEYHDADGSTGRSARSIVGEEVVELDQVPEDEQEYHDADEEVKEVAYVAEDEKTAK